ncbi:gluconate 2-dehydrogenase subunit 3 family protein [Halomicroarcula sp. GCM10025817]|uniref:gluconate 2-dehydrogenase subunit 3 family protein n=1 Tax=Haloarcula TaxID=2237 RepID=UPI0023E85DC6|nr:gluconate 2-dehydrogenase subunit 3 family protein [Halomicroarcula sp. SYNS111]
MRLTRRDAVLSLLVGIGTGVAGFADIEIGEEATDEESARLTERHVDTAVATAETVYPSGVSGTAEFVSSYVGGLPDDRSAEMARTAVGLDEYARRERGRPFATLSSDARDSVLRSMGVDRTGSSSDGSLSERVRFYLVNQLLYGLYTSPTGSKLVGIENPVGYPGGYESYQRPPTDRERAYVATTTEEGPTRE